MSTPDQPTLPTAGVIESDWLEALCRLIERRAPDGDDRVELAAGIADKLAQQVRALLSRLNQPTLPTAAPLPWEVRRCGMNWDICYPAEPGHTGVGVVATVFCGDDPAVAQGICDRHNASLNQPTEDKPTLSVSEEVVERVKRFAKGGPFVWRDETGTDFNSLRADLRALLNTLQTDHSSGVRNMVRPKGEEMVERVARAIWLTSQGFAQLDGSNDSWASLPDYAQDHQRDLARAAIAALGSCSLYEGERK